MAVVILIGTKRKIEIIKLCCWYFRNQWSNGRVGVGGEGLGVRGFLRETKPCHLSCRPPSLTLTHVVEQGHKAKDKNVLPFVGPGSVCFTLACLRASCPSGLGEAYFNPVSSHHFPSKSLQVFSIAHRDVFYVVVLCWELVKPQKKQSASSWNTSFTQIFEDPRVLDEINMAIFWVLWYLTDNFRDNSVLYLSTEVDRNLFTCIYSIPL